MFTRALLQPLRQVVAKVQRIGAGDLSTRLPVVRNDEFGRLARAVNEMAEAVARSVTLLQETDRMRRELIAGIGHDLRTPLATLLGYLEEAQRHLEAGRLEATRAALEVVRARGRHLERLIEDLFELSVLERPEPSLHREPVPLAELLEETARAHRRLFAEAGIVLQTSWPAELPILEADGSRLRRVLDNLLDNARRHTPPGGTVELRADVTETTVRLAVQDTGPGLTPEEQARLFAPSQPQGTGLGLRVSQAIARAHGGWLEVESMPGHGSTFSLVLPRQEMQFD
jgi:signal transduction histidine kinase